MFLRKEFFSSEKKVKKKKDLFIFYKPLCKGWLSIDEVRKLFCYVRNPDPEAGCLQMTVYFSARFPRNVQCVMGKGVSWILYSSIFSFSF